MPPTLRIVLLLILLALCCSCAAVKAFGSPQTYAEPLADPAAMTYRAPWRESGAVTLVDGMFREPAAPGSAAENIVELTDWQAFGTVDGEEVGVVILVTQTGGSGSFYDLALLERRGAQWVNSDSVLLGDRVVIHSMAIRDGEIVVDMTGHGPQDPMCCPTQQAERHFTLQGGQLVAREPAAGAVQAPPLVGPAWCWLSTQYNDDSRAVPPNPQEYTVTFARDGTLSVRADCNQKGGTYQAKDGSLEITITHSTMAMCPENSLESNFERDLSGAASWFFKDGDLYVDLIFDTGTMRFNKNDR